MTGQLEYFTMCSVDYYTCPGCTVSCPQPELMTQAAATPLTGWRLMGDKWETLSRWITGGKSCRLSLSCRSSPPQEVWHTLQIHQHSKTHSTRLCCQQWCITHADPYTSKVICFHTHRRWDTIKYFHRKTELPHLNPSMSPSKGQEFQQCGWNPNSCNVMKENMAPTR